jgi:hypothetical protein
MTVRADASVREPADEHPPLADATKLSENACLRCDGSGWLNDGRACPGCSGTGPLIGV